MKRMCLADNKHKQWSVCGVRFVAEYSPFLTDDPKKVTCRLCRSWLHDHPQVEKPQMKQPLLEIVEDDSEAELAKLKETAKKWTENPGKMLWTGLPDVREQRRWELAKELFVAGWLKSVELDGEYDVKEGAKGAVDFADALLDALEKKS